MKRRNREISIARRQGIKKVQKELLLRAAEGLIVLNKKQPAEPQDQPFWDDFEESVEALKQERKNQKET